MSDALTDGTADLKLYFRLALAALAISGVPELTASIGYGGSPVTTVAGMLALGVMAGMGESGKPWQHMLAAAALLPVGGALSHLIADAATGPTEVLLLVLSPVFYAGVVFTGSLAVRLLAEGNMAESWPDWLQKNRDGSEAFSFAVIAAAMFPYLSFLWPLGSLLAAGVVSYRYPGRVWRHSIAITTAFLGMAFLRILSDILVDVNSHGHFPFELVVAFLLSAPFSFLGAAAGSRLAGKS